MVVRENGRVLEGGGGRLVEVWAEKEAVVFFRRRHWFVGRRDKKGNMGSVIFNKY